MTGTLSSRSTAGGGLGTDFDLGGGLVTHALTGEGFDASEDGTGRGTPLVPVAFDTYNQTVSDTTQTLCSRGDTPGGNAHLVPAIAFSAKDYGADAGDISPTLRAGGHTGSHANAGVMPAIAFQSSQSGVREVEAHATLDANNGARRHNGVVQGMQVRRLTPRECERLQGFYDDYTAVPHRGKPAADGPRYKALGNSWAVPCARWIGQRINAVEQITVKQLEAA